MTPLQSAIFTFVINSLTEQGIDGEAGLLRAVVEDLQSGSSQFRAEPQKPVLNVQAFLERPSVPNVADVMLDLIEPEEPQEATPTKPDPTDPPNWGEVLGEPEPTPEPGPGPAAGWQITPDLSEPFGEPVQPPAPGDQKAKPWKAAYSPTVAARVEVAAALGIHRVRIEDLTGVEGREAGIILHWRSESVARLKAALGTSEESLVISEIVTHYRERWAAAGRQAEPLEFRFDDLYQAAGRFEADPAKAKERQDAAVRSRLESVGVTE